MKHTGRAAALSVVFAAALFSLAAVPVARADADAGRQKAAPCAACHGPEGNSANPAVPSLAGQPAQFITMQLFQFREGNRKNEQMTPMAANLSNADMNDLAAYFSALKPAPPARQASAEHAAAAPALTKKYNCVQCHGPALVGQQHIPRLAGQQLDYLRAQLRGFKAQTRADIDGIMTSAAQPLTEADIEALADYLSALPR
ncbi:MAG TPA: c-type cytochrome [Burkholderiales bacterium]